MATSRLIGVSQRLLAALAASMLVSVGCSSSADRVDTSAAAPQTEQTPSGQSESPTTPEPAGETTPADQAPALTPAQSPQPAAQSAGAKPATGASAQGRPAQAASPAPTPTKAAEGSDPSKGAAPGTPAPVQPGGPAPAPAPVEGARAPIKLGSIGTDTGPIGQAVIGNLHGAKAWAAEVNAQGGLNGHPVQIIFGDDAGDPARALALAKRMVEQDGVIAFSSIYAPVTGQGFTPYLEQKKIPGLETCSCSATADSSPMLFPIGNGSTEGNAWAHLAGLLALSDKRNVGLLYCREVNTCSQVNEAVTAHEADLGIKIVYRGQITLAQPDYTAEVLAARNAGADALVLVTVNSGAIRIARSAHRQNYNPVFSSQFNPHDERFLKDGGEDVEGFTFVARTAPWSISPKMADFRAALQKNVPGAVSSDHTAVGWMAGKALEKMAPRFPAGPVTTNDILEGLYSFRGETLGGLVPPLTFKRDAGHVDTNQCDVPMTVKGGKFVAPKGEEFTCAPWWKPPQP